MSDAIFRHLPDVYRRAGRDGTPTYALINAVGGQFAQINAMTERVLRSRFFEQADELEDLERLAALFELAPWPEENNETFRQRVRLVVATLLRGSVTPRSLLELVAAASQAALDPMSVIRVDNRTTRGDYIRRVDGQRFVAEVVDMPPVLREVTVGPETGWFWEIENRSYRDPGGLNEPPTLPEPVIDIHAGAEPVVLPILVQRDLRRFVLVNRFIPPGAVLRIDMQNRSLQQIAGPLCLTGPVRMNATSPPVDLLYGTGGLLGDPLLSQLSGPLTRPFHLLRWSDTARTGSNLPEVPGPVGSDNPAPWFSMPMPPLLGWGYSHWRLMLGANRDGLAPVLGENLIIQDQDLTTQPVTAANGPAKIIFRWLGGQPGTFTVRFPERFLSNEPNPTRALPHRVRWLHEQIGRTRPAGVIWYDQNAPELTPQLPEPVGGPPVLSLWERQRAGYQVSAPIQRVSRSLTLEAATLAGDAVQGAVKKEEESI
jgi:hypothetical protein